ncbi:MAG: hypothetical protein C5B50_16440 [Verrucomicrobia bacterium]|nr:MAG: hypothetical protein C5B50_16440 [Verrucomicrobiota bacterium]
MRNLKGAKPTTPLQLLRRPWCSMARRPSPLTSFCTPWTRSSVGSTWKWYRWAMICYGLRPFRSGLGSITIGTMVFHRTCRHRGSSVATRRRARLPISPWTEAHGYFHCAAMRLRKPLSAEGSGPARRNIELRSPLKFELWNLKFLSVFISGYLWLPSFGSAAEPPTIPVGLDAYRQWERWPYQRIGARAYMRSTYDRRGGNEGADASHFLYQLADDRNVTLDVQGPGILYFARFNHWHGSPWHFEVDDVDHIVSETSTSDPNHPATDSIILPQKAFSNPLAWTWSAAKGADLSWIPIPFEKSFRLAYSRTHYGTGYYIYQQYVPGAKLSRSIRSWKEDVPDREVLGLITRAGTDLVPAAESAAGRRRHIKEMKGSFKIAADESRQAFGGSSIAALSQDAKTKAAEYAALQTLREDGHDPAQADLFTILARLTDAPSLLRALEFTVPRAEAIEFGRARLRIYWDDSQEPSVDTPIALFFGAGTLYNRDNRDYLVKAFPVHIRFDERSVHLACYFPMPFFHRARIELAPGSATASVAAAIPACESETDDATRNTQHASSSLPSPNSQLPSSILWSIRYESLHASPSEVGYFHATYRDHTNPEPGKDLTLLDTRQTEGGGDWSGHFVGTSFIFSDRAVLNTLEGDPRFFFDDSQTPQAYGTGTEEWGGGGDYWGGRNMSLPFAGHPTGARNAKEALNDEDKIESAYRFLLGDLMPFGKNAIIRLEHGGLNDSTEHYQTVAYWYGRHAPSLVQTDQLKIGDQASESTHHYAAPDASAPYEITSRYEWGPDTLKGKEIYLPHTDVGRKTAGASEFNLQLNPKNLGVLLRRKLDYQFPNQRAEVFVAPVRKNGVPGTFKPAGIWYLAGANTCVYSNPKEELGPTQHIVQTSNRRFRDDEFLVPRNLTQGRSEIRIRIKFVPVPVPLFPGQPLPELAWSEIRYDAYCFRMPD